MQEKSMELIRGVVIDMDGVLVRGASPLPGISEFFALLETHSLAFMVATNNATTTPERLAKRLSEVGVRIAPSQVITSAIAAADYMRQNLVPGGTIFVVGEAPLRDAIASAGFEISEAANGAQAVVVGLDRKATWRKLTEAALAIQAGATFIGTNPDASLPTERGQVIGNGALLAAIETATGVRPIIIGKPETYLYRLALQRLGTKAQETLALGDRLDTDILGGIKAGMATALVLTGVSTRQDLENTSDHPDWVFADLNELTSQFASAFT